MDSSSLMAILLTSMSLAATSAFAQQPQHQIIDEGQSFHTKTSIGHHGNSQPAQPERQDRPALPKGDRLDVRNTPDQPYSDRQQHHTEQRPPMMDPHHDYAGDHDLKMKVESMRRHVLDLKNPSDTMIPTRVISTVPASAPNLGPCRF